MSSKDFLVFQQLWLRFFSSFNNSDSRGWALLNFLINFLECHNFLIEFLLWKLASSVRNIWRHRKFITNINLDNRFEITSWYNLYHLLWYFLLVVWILLMLYNAGESVTIGQIFLIYRYSASDDTLIAKFEGDFNSGLCRQIYDSPIEMLLLNQVLI